ncbi:helix-turn-helix domain-containing protein [Corynebacterium pseudodiphtheriticum]|uniref:helix-turn-helix domain-containing protein n=1 Tax=Corynebacterium pseudodiphtheriticum TaxID=37637 RepID=UPI001F6081E9|nr:helix-turn-helix transcriptional regulator [Corynebacterium pseudodiphtheriticum]UNU74599.1 helix-turn-helix transcriptional regulator [Corynebacterium pseudodiphtheriticum]UNU76422.1 helix-turn-helix transcriptional regulator [Corynebacterium pseudodiphtheriticum]
MATQSVVLDTPIITGEPTAYHERLAQPEPLLRQALGLALRAFRADKGVTLRELAKAARVSPGYISELERGRKEVSSELLASVCHALNATVTDVLIEAAGNMAMTSVDQELAKASPAAAEPVSEL